MEESASSYSQARLFHLDICLSFAYHSSPQIADFQGQILCYEYFDQKGRGRVPQGSKHNCTEDDRSVNRIVTRLIAQSVLAFPSSALERAPARIRKLQDLL